MLFAACYSIRVRVRSFKEPLSEIKGVRGVGRFKVAKSALALETTHELEGYQKSTITKHHDKGSFSGERKYRRKEGQKMRLIRINLVSQIAVCWHPRLGEWQWPLESAGEAESRYVIP